MYKSRTNYVLIGFLSILLVACVAVPPKNSDDLCATFREKSAWYADAARVYRKWGIPVPVMMAIMYQESHFVADAKPPRGSLLGFIPWSRPSTAYGYAQALDETWEEYLSDAGSWGADRDDFSDAADFIGWYGHISHNRLGIPKTDAKNLYLAYHEGHEGYRHKSYLGKNDLRQIAELVARQAKVFQKQLDGCNVES